jgi:hypothetical protein
MEQTKLGSLIEVCINTLIGFVIAMISQLIIFPVYGVHIALSTDIKIGLWFTLVSVLRSYCIRRWFNSVLKNYSGRLAKYIRKG